MVSTSINKIGDRTMNGKKCKDGHNINPGTGNPSGLIRKSADADTNPKLGK